MASDEAEEAGRACMPHASLRAYSLNSAKGKARNVIVPFFFFTFHLENDFCPKKLQKQYDSLERTQVKSQQTCQCLTE